jgi:hypothetical protein
MARYTKNMNACGCELEASHTRYASTRKAYADSEQ